MKYAIVESGGKQYKAVEGQVIEVDRLAVDEGAQVNVERVLLMADGDSFVVGTPTIKNVLVKTTVVDHFRGPKAFRFKYSPKKRIRVRGGHRQQYTRLMVDFIGRPGEVRKFEKIEQPVETEFIVKAEVEAAPKVEKKQAKTPAKEAKAPAPKKAPAKKSTSAKPAAKKSATKK